MNTPSPEMNLDNLRTIKVLGKGAMGTVFLVHNRATDPSAQCPFALKVAEKSTFHTKFDADRRARWEISVLNRLHHPFLPTLFGSLETDEFLAWAVPYCPGGDLNVLRYHQTDRIFSPSAIRFYVAEIVCALEYLHRMCIVYRDLKPENVLIQESGHVTLTDFDLSRVLAPKQAVAPPVAVEQGKLKHRRNLTRLISVPNGLRKAKSARVSPVSRRKSSFSTGERSNSFVGTEEYVSPEVVRGDGHEFAVDWWALGILAYEMMYGKTPFKGINRKETFRNVLMKQPEFIGKRTALIDLIERLLEKDPTKRLGYNRGAMEIKEHEFFRGLRWDLLTEVLRPPFIAFTEEETPLKMVAGGNMDVKEYFRNMKEKKVSVPPSPTSSTLTSEYYQRNLSLTEF